MANRTIREVPNRLYTIIDKYYIVNNIVLSQFLSSISLSKSDIYGLISLFADVYYLFTTNISGFRQITYMLAT